MLLKLDVIYIFLEMLVKYKLFYQINNTNI